MCWVSYAMLVGSVEGWGKSGSEAPIQTYCDSFREEAEKWRYLSDSMLLHYCAPGSGLVRL